MKLWIGKSYKVGPVQMHVGKRIGEPKQSGKPDKLTEAAQNFVSLLWIGLIVAIVIVILNSK